jgi:galactofuranosylgalactofuranosylrhamnosyl-N-acetylglucosaminyl-diphospho-decaprenol beta-1,5/1,6-galactofuranosyltransferase
MVMDQGKDKVTDSEFFPAAKQGLGDKLRVIVQGNLGGSGGYARGQLESRAQGHRDVRADDGRRRRV